MKKIKFNYFTLIKVIEEISLSNPFVNNFYNSSTKINSTNDIDYAAIVVIPQSIDIDSNTGVNTFNLQVVYADRNKTDRDDTLDIQSIGIDTISEIFLSLKNYGVRVDSINFTSIFKERFADNCSGCIAAVSLRTPSYTTRCGHLKCLEC